MKVNYSNSPHNIKETSVSDTLTDTFKTLGMPENLAKPLSDAGVERGISENSADNLHRFAQNMEKAREKLRASKNKKEKNLPDCKFKGAMGTISFSNTMSKALGNNMIRVAGSVAASAALAGYLNTPACAARQFFADTVDALHDSGVTSKDIQETLNKHTYTSTQSIVINKAKSAIAKKVPFRSGHKEPSVNQELKESWNEFVSHAYSDDANIPHASPETHKAINRYSEADRSAATALSVTLSQTMQKNYLPISARAIRHGAREGVIATGGFDVWRKALDQSITAVNTRLDTPASASSVMEDMPPVPPSGIAPDKPQNFWQEFVKGSVKILDHTSLKGTRAPVEEGILSLPQGMSRE